MPSSKHLPVDLEATRLIFVMLKGCKPMRKVAIPITDNTSWPAFEAQVMAKLRIQGVQSMTMAQTGEPVTSLGQLQDIDQVHVQEAAAVPAASTSAMSPGQTSYSSAHQPLSVESRSNVNGSAELALPQSHGATNEQQSTKYTKKKSIVASFMRGFKSQSLLPTTTRDSEIARKGRRRSRITTLQGMTFCILILFAMFVILRYAFVFSPVNESPVVSHESNAQARLDDPIVSTDTITEHDGGDKEVDDANSDD